MARSGRGRPGRRHRRRVGRGGHGRHRRRLLPRALDGRVDRLLRRRTARRPRRSATPPPRRSLGRIVYLGGLGRDDDPNLSAHLQSRHEVGRVLADGPVPVTELRAAMIIGSGSASFEMLRYLVEVLPVMICPAGCTTAASRSPSATCCSSSSPCSAADRHRGAGPRSRRARRPHLPRHDAHLRRGGRPPPATDPARAGARRRACRRTGSASSPRCPPASPGRWCESLINEVVVEDRPITDGDRPPTRCRSARRSSGRCARVADLAGRRPAGPTPRCPAAARPTRCRPTPTGPAAACCATSRRRRATRRRRPVPDRRGHRRRNAAGT